MLKPSLSGNLTIGLLSIYPVLILAFGLATASDRYMPTAMATLVLCCAAVALPLIALACPRFNRNQSLLLLAGLIGILIPVGVQWMDHAPISVWWKSGERLLALTLAACIMSAPVPLSRMLHAFLASASLAMIMAFIGIWSGGGLLGDNWRPESHFWHSFGLGNPNLLVNTVGLAACGHLVWMISSLRQGQQVPRASIILAILGFTATLIFALLSERRGIVLAGVFGVSVLGVSALWRNHRALAWTVIVILLILFAAGVVYGLATKFTEMRSLRVLQYHALMELSVDRWWIGHGSYASRLVQYASTDACATFNTIGVWLLSAHCEPLDALLEAGVVGLALCVGLMALTWRQCWAHAPGRDQVTLLFLVAGAMVIACLDNAYTRLIGMWWVACLVGLVFHGEAAPSGLVWKALRPQAWITALLAALGTTMLTSSAFMSQSATPSVHIRTAQQTIEPDLMIAHISKAANILESEGDLVATDALLELWAQRIGPSSNSLRRLVAVRLNGRRPDETLVAPLAQLSKSVIFDGGIHIQIAGLLVRRPDLADRFSPVVCERAARWAGFAKQTRLTLPFALPNSAEEAATQLAQLAWAQRHQADDPGIGPSLLNLLDAYPTSTSIVGVIIQQFIARSQPGIVLDSQLVSRMDRAFPVDIEAGILSFITSSEQAVRLRPLLQRHYTEATGIHAHEISRVLTLATIDHQKPMP